jgi:hypothetical protein
MADPALEALIEQLRAKAEANPADADARVIKAEQDAAAAENERSRAVYDRNVMQGERDAALKELAKVKADVGWMMDKLQIRDLFRLRGGEDVPCAAEGWLPNFGTDPEDSARIKFVNEHGRVGGSTGHWIISIPHNIDLDTATLPDVYNFRHIIDLSRASLGK